MNHASKFRYMLSRSLYVLLLLTLLLGIAYPLVITKVSALIFPHEAAGSLIYDEDKVVGSALIGQKFSTAETSDGESGSAPEFLFFWSRPSAGDYNALSSGGSNFGPNHPKQHEAIAARIQQLQAARSAVQAPYVPVPYDLLTASGSGLDPHISLEAAIYQAPMVAAANHMDTDAVVKLIMQHAQSNLLSSVPYVNVLELNISLHQLQAL